MEIWKDIKDYEGLYQVSSLGRVKSLERKTLGKYGGIKKERILKSNKNNGGYLRLDLCKNGVQKNCKIHQLVAIAFLNHTPCGHKLVVNHKNFNKLDNRLENLEIITQRENSNLKHKESTSKFVGVFWDKSRGKWHSKIQINGKSKFLGYFKCEIKASEAYTKELKSLTKC
jgi:hypothetical protein